jgi:hypothetical protein
MRAHNMLCNSFFLCNSLRRAVNRTGCEEQWPECVYILKVVYSELFYLISYRIAFCTMWHVYVLCVRHIHDPMLLP